MLSRRCFAMHLPLRKKRARVDGLTRARHESGAQRVGYGRRMVTLMPLGRSRSRGARQDRANRDDGLGDTVRVQVGPEDLPKLLLIGRNRPEALDYHLIGPVGILDRLLFERGAEPGPELLLAEYPVDDGRGAAGGRLSVGVRGELLRVSPAVIGLVATHAGNGSVIGPAFATFPLVNAADSPVGLATLKGSAVRHRAFYDGHRATHRFFRESNCSRLAGAVAFTRAGSTPAPSISQLGCTRRTARGCPSAYRTSNSFYSEPAALLLTGPRPELPGFAIPRIQP